MEEHVPKKSGFYPPVLNEQIKIAVRWTHWVLLLLLICEFSTVAHKKECKRLFEGQFFRIFLRPHTTTRKRPLNTSSNLNLATCCPYISIKHTAVTQPLFSFIMVRIQHFNKAF